MKEAKAEITVPDVKTSNQNGTKQPVSNVDNPVRRVWHFVFLIDTLNKLRAFLHLCVTLVLCRLELRIILSRVKRTRLR